MEAALNLNRQRMFANRPKALVCHICGREFGTKSLSIHLKSCAKKWEDAEAKKPKHLRRPVPQPTSSLPLGTSLEEIALHNERAMQTFEKQAMKQCPHCQRTFLEERLDIHLRSCTAERPHKPVNKPKDSPLSSPPQNANEELPVHLQTTTEDKSIRPQTAPEKKPLGRKSTFDPVISVEEAETNDRAELQACLNCGRKFAVDRLSTHQSICQKAKSRATKVFPSASQRIIDPIMTSPAKIEVKTDPEKWRREHEDFVEAMKFVKTTPKKPEVPTPSPHPEHITCPHCGRVFAPHVAERHIPICRDVRHKPKPPPTNRLSVISSESIDEKRAKSPQPTGVSKAKAVRIRPETAAVTRHSVDSSLQPPRSPRPTQSIPPPPQSVQPPTQSIPLPSQSVHPPQPTQPANAVLCPECQALIPVTQFYAHIQDCKGSVVTEVEAERPQTAPVKNFCPMCGTRYVPGARFCASCGVKK